MSNYVKLFGSILDSSIMDAPVATRWTWVALMAMADQDGKVEASMGGVAHRARVSREECEQAFAYFTSPDPDSKTPDNEGRRIEKIDGGWRLLNYEYYRALQDQEDRRAKAAARQQRRRDRMKEKVAVTPPVTQSHASHAIRSDQDLVSSPSPVVIGSDPDSKVGANSEDFWTPFDWQRRYGLAWSKAYSTMALPGGGQAAARATADLGDMLAELDAAARLNAQARSPSMFAEFLAERSPQVVRARHPWAWFVTRFPGLLVAAKDPETPVVPQDVMVGHTDQRILPRVAGPVKL